MLRRALGCKRYLRDFIGWKGGRRVCGAVCGWMRVAGKGVLRVWLEGVPGVWLQLECDWEGVCGWFGVGVAG